MPLAMRTCDRELEGLSSEVRSSGSSRLEELWRTGTDRRRERGDVGWETEPPPLPSAMRDEGLEVRGSGGSASDEE